MTKVMNLNKSADEAVIEFLRHLLNNELVSGVLTLMRTKNRECFSYAFVTDADALDMAVPLAPVMPSNAGTILSSLTQSKKRIAAVVRPCEQRAFIERVKREQGSLENVLLISHTCGGVYPLKTVIEEKKEDLFEKYHESLCEGHVPDNVRPTCKACENCIPVNTDITISIIGEKNIKSECSFFLNSEAAVELCKDFSETMTDGNFDESLLKKHLEVRRETKENLFNTVVTQEDGLDGLIDVFGKCVGCHGCGHVCPICYCVLCDFESHNYDYNSAIYEKELSQKGAFRLPSDTIFFHLGRMSHMSFSCVNCGQCTDVCPADIPVAAIFMRTGEQTASLFDYAPGRDVEESIPVMVFKEEEFQELGE